MSQWAEIRYMHEVGGVAKKEIARRLDLDIKTVRSALRRRAAPLRRSSPLRRCALDPLRERIESLLKGEPELTAKRIARLLEGESVLPGERAVREYVAKLRRKLFAPEAFVHRTHRPGDSSEFDFGDSRARIGGQVRVVKYSRHEILSPIPTVAGRADLQTHCAAWMTRELSRVVRARERTIGEAWLDEVPQLIGFLPISEHAADLLFQALSERHERGSVIVNSNLPFAEWGKVFQTERLAVALLDRITHRAHILEMNGESYRLKSAKRKTPQRSKEDSAK